MSTNTDELVQLLLQQMQIQRGQIEALTCAVNALTVVATGTKPELANIFADMFLDLSRRRENSSTELDTDLALGGFRSKLEDVIGYVPR